MTRGIFWWLGLVTGLAYASEQTCLLSNSQCRRCHTSNDGDCHEAATRIIDGLDP